jgi:hypothetical protein
MVEALRKDDLIELRDKRLHMLEPARLRRIAMFNPAYLHLQAREPRGTTEPAKPFRDRSHKSRPVGPGCDRRQAASDPPAVGKAVFQRSASRFA